MDLETRKLTHQQYEILRYCEQYYWLNGRLPSYDTLVSELGPRSEADTSQAHTLLSGPFNMSKRDFQDLLNNRVFIDNLTSRQVPAHATSLLTEEQITVANIMLDLMDKRSKLKKLTELGVSTQTYNSWLRQPAYRAYCLARAEDLLQASQPTAHMSLIGNVERGDLGSIKYFNAMTGRFRERAQSPSVNVEVNNTTNVATTPELLVQVVEIIQRHVKEPEVLDAIASDILELTRGGSKAGAAIEGSLAI